MSYNSRRNILGAVPLAGEMAYHLWNVGYSTKKSGYSVNLIKKAKWPALYSIDEGD